MGWSNVCSKPNTGIGWPHHAVMINEAIAPTKTRVKSPPIGNKYINVLGSSTSPRWVGGGGGFGNLIGSFGKLKGNFGNLKLPDLDSLSLCLFSKSNSLLVTFYF